jgi:hypothetical protein
MWWQKRLDLTAQVYFRGTLPPSLEGLDGLGRVGVEVRPGPPAPEMIWTAKLHHPDWGPAELAAPRHRQALPDFMADFGTGLSPQEREQLRQRAECPLVLHVPAAESDVLRDRKRLLHLMQAVLGDDGVAGVDMMAQMVWTPPRLADELQHEAPLDIIQIHVLHVVTQAAGVWLHSHGLGEMGFVDFDVLRPAEGITGEQFDVLRAIAFAIVEGASSGAISPVSGAEPVELVDASSFMKGASGRDRELRDVEYHTERRVVCCDPVAPGVVARLFGAREIRPSRLLSRGMVEGRHLVNFSREATELAALRARECLSLFGSLAEEFADMRCMSLVKLGYQTDSGSGADTEHLWFEAHGVAQDTIDATLLNEPFAIAGMSEGQRGTHPIERLTDWAILTPLGQLTPRTLELARHLREARPEILKALQEKS